MIIDTSEFGAFGIAKTYINNQKIAGISIDLTLNQYVNGFNGTNDLSQKTTLEIIKYLNAQTLYKCSFKTDESSNNIHIRCIQKY